MNWQGLKKLSGSLVKLRPMPIGFWRPDDDWMIERVSQKLDAIDLRNISTGHVLNLHGDGVYGFEKGRSRHSRGFLMLRRQIYVNGVDIVAEPLQTL